MFTVHTTDTGAVQPYEYLAAAAGTYKAGQLLTVADGKLAAISAASTAAPEYLCQADITAVAGDVIPVTRVSKDAIYASTLSAAADGAAVGSKLRISAGGVEVDAGAAGKFEVVSIAGNAKGDAVLGRFI